MKYELKKGHYTLTHRRIINYMGFEVDRFELFDEEKRIHFPFYGDMKVSDKDKDFPINKIPYEYTEEDYKKMLDKQICHYKSKIEV